jgi:hypothetical protein
MKLTPTDKLDLQAAASPPTTENAVTWRQCILWQENTLWGPHLLLSSRSTFTVANACTLSNTSSDFNFTTIYLKMFSIQKISYILYRLLFDITFIMKRFFNLEKNYYSYWILIVKVSYGNWVNVFYFWLVM